MKWEGYNEGKRNLEGAMERAFNDLLGILTREYTITISTPGAFPGFEGQDIVDFGFFRSSLGNPWLTTQSDPPALTNVDPKAPAPMRETGALVGAFIWHADYSLLLHTGYTTKTGRVVGGRPWTDETHKRLDVDQIFASLFRRYAGT